MLASIMDTLMIPPPQLASQSCLNADLREDSDHACHRCRDVCPAGAIQLSDSDAPLPLVDSTACTGCTGCVSICPTDAMRHADVKPAALVRHCTQLAQQGKTVVTAACSTADRAHADITIPCHAAWTPMLLASLAAEGIKQLYLDGIDQCSDCPMRFGAEIMQQTEKDYAVFNQALGVHLSISHGSQQRDASMAAGSADKPADEPERRAFFRHLIPSLAQGAARASEQLTQAARLAANAQPQTESAPVRSPLPVRLQLFLRALPKLQSNFMPLPAMPSMPLGAIQADAHCTACGQCVETCPTCALHLREFGSNRILEFRADACIGCSRCIDICPAQALEALPGISLPAVLTKKARPLVMVAYSDTRADSADSNSSDGGE